jgi:replicative DNA helicase
MEDNKTLWEIQSIAHAINKLAFLLDKKYFNNPIVLKILEIMETLVAQKAPVESKNILCQAYLTDIDNYEAIAQYMQYITDSCAELSIDKSYGKLKEAYYKESLISHNEKINKCLEEQPQIGLDAILLNSKGYIDELILESTPVDSLSDIKKAALSAYDDILAIQLGKKPPAISTGSAFLDEMLTGGFQRGQYYVIGGRPGMGKTMLALNLAYDISKSKPVLFYSLEMDKEKLIQRLFSRLTKIPLGRLLSPHSLSTEELTKLEIELRTLSKCSLYFNDGRSQHGNNNTSDIDTIINESQKVAQDIELGAIFIDYIQLITTTNRFVNPTESLTYISGALRDLAKKSNIPIIVLTQLNRNVEGRMNKRAGISDLRGAGAIEEHAAGVVLPYCDAYYNKELAGESTVELEIDVAKNRFGGTGVIKMKWHRPTFSIEDGGLV